MLLSWCSTCSFSRRQPGPFALHVLSKLNQTELESNPNSFSSPSWKSDYVDSHLLKYWEVPSLLVLGQMVSALLHQWGWSRTGSLRGPDTTEQAQLRLFIIYLLHIPRSASDGAICIAEITVDATSSSTQTLFYFQKKLDIISETQTHQNMHICWNNHGNQQEETVLPLMFWKVLTLLWQQETG